MLTKGDKVQVPTRMGHIFHGLKDATVVEYSPQYYNKDDAFKIDIE
jgi:hypothetical protein